MKKRKNQPMEVPEPHKLSNAELSFSEIRYRRLFESAREGILILDGDSGKIIEANPFFVELLGYQYEKLTGKEIWEIGPFKDILASKEAIIELQDKGYIRYENLPLKTSDGRHINVEYICNVYLEGQRKVIQCNIRDITKQKKMEEQLRELSLTDELTGLTNRRGFMLLAKHQIEVSHRDKNKLVLIFADIDSMKSINDTFGHSGGDQALIDTAAILRNSFRASDIVARFGGDEFAVISVEEEEMVERLIKDRLRENLLAHNHEAERPYRLFLSFGITIYDPDNPCTLEELLERGDRLMYEQKQNGKLERLP
jgi:diguanylate cyclase (GGDEF)-like protein/PAS domain S-box-containing protein